MLQFQMGSDTSALIKGHSWNKSGLEETSSLFSLDVSVQEHDTFAALRLALL